MAKQVITDALIAAHGYDLSNTSNSVALEYGADAVADTCFGAGTRTAAGGLKTVSMGAEGYWQSAPDASLFSRVGVAGGVVTVAARGDTGDPAYSFAAMVGEYAPEGSVGEMFGFTVSAAAQDQLFRGTVLAEGLASGGGTGSWGSSWLQLGSVSASQRAHIAVHVLSITGGGSVSAFAQSGPGNAPAPVDRTTQHAFGSIPAPGSAYASVAGPITDSWWRLLLTFEGGATAASVLAVIGIQ